MDFKENFKISNDPIKTRKKFYKKIQILLLKFVIFYKDNNNIIQTQYFDYFLKILNYDSLL